MRCGRVEQESGGGWKRTTGSSRHGALSCALATALLLLGPSGLAHAAPTAPVDAALAPAPSPATNPTRPEELVTGPASGEIVDASIALGAELVLGATWYWIDVESNGKDWQYDFSLESWHKKLVTREALRFDDNSFAFNGIAHPFAGSMYYLTGRSMRWGLLPSALVSVAGSTAWELLVEFREVASLNDLIITPVGGAALGEAMFQFSELYRTRTPTRLNRFLSHLFLGPAALNPLRPDVEHSDGEQWGRVRLTTGALAGPSQRGVRPRLGLEAVTVPLPGYEKPGSGRSLHGSVSFARLMLDGEASGLQVPTLSGRAELVWSGLRFRHATGQEGRLYGADLLLGLGSSMYLDQLRFDEREQGPELDEQIMVSPVDVRALATGYIGPLTLRFSGSISPVFGASTAHALPQYRAEAGIDSAPSVVREHGYYFGTGWASASRWVAEFAGFELGVDMRGYRLRATRGLDRPEPEPVLSLASADRRMRRTLWLDYGLPIIEGLRVGLTSERHLAWGTVEESHATAEERRVQMRLLYAL